MVLLEMVGKKRSFGRGVLLTILTFGLYGPYWLYKAHDELYKQFELQREGRDEGVVWLILGLLLFPFQFVYMWMFVGNVDYLRRRLELPAGVSPGLFLGLQIAAYVAMIAGYLQFALALTADATEQEIADVFAQRGPGLLLGLLTGVVLVAVAYYRLQTDVNDVWTAYEQRIQNLRATGSAMPPGSAPTLAPQFTYWGDLRPSQPQQGAAPGSGMPFAMRLSAPHVRARADALLRDNPGLASPPGLEDALQRAEAGDDAELTRAARMLDETDALLAERARLHDELADAERKQGRLAGRLANGEVDNAAYAAARAELDRERARVQARLAEVEARLYGPPPSQP